MVTAFLLALVTGSLAYCALVMIAARAYLRQRPANLSAAPPISVLSPLEGIEDGLERNLRSFFEQRYPAFELLFAVRRADDPALDVVRRLMAEFPGVPARILITGEPPYPNAKVFSLQRMHAVAAHEVLVMKDSDVRAGPDMIQTIAAEFQDAAVGLVTCPYQAIAARGFWWKLDALGMNTQFLGGVLVARMLEGMRFALGPAIAIRKRVLADIGGLDSLTDYLAEDFVMGQAASGRGHGVILSSYVIEHHIGGGDFSSNMRHRLRWVRSTRRSRPKGYVGELFTNPVPLASALLVWNPSFWPVALGTLLVRYVTAWVTVRRVLRRRVTFQDWLAIPFQDLLSFLFWLAGFFGKTVLWRGRQYQLGRDGRIALH